MNRTGTIPLFAIITVASVACGSRDLYTSGRGDVVGAAESSSVVETSSNSEATSQPTGEAGQLSDRGHDGAGGHGDAHMHGEGHHGGAEGPEGHAMHGHQHTFDDPEHYATRWEGHERDEWQQPDGLVLQLGLAPGMTVADLGTGTGYLLPWLSAAVGNEGVVFAIDVEPAMLAWVAERIQQTGWTNVQTHAGEYDSPAVAGETLDCAVMVNVWHHIEHRDVYAAALLQSMKPGASAFIVETRMDAPDGPPMHYRLPPEAVIEVLQAAGFDASLTDWQNERQYMVRATRPQ
ncbi:MAG: methyltransferase domain-containing protein [Myxococcales bacterium]|nr:methyltransferase domain-containing protein [Myxococcales bacterium]